ncbi:MAG: glycosyl transferase family 9, partial [Selenomonas sp.]|nr:glycosyl transferase family 9 [Selenomonas sp.]
QLDLLISVDTGGAHIAAVTGVPLVVMFGCTSPRRWHPISDNAAVFTSHEPCCPCSYRETDCPSYPQPNCLYHVRPDAVLAECVKFLDGNM